MKQKIIFIILILLICCTRKEKAPDVMIILADSYSKGEEFAANINYSIGTETGSLHINGNLKKSKTRIMLEVIDVYPSFEDSRLNRIYRNFFNNLTLYKDLTKNETIYYDRNTTQFKDPTLIGGINPEIFVVKERVEGIDIISYDLEAGKYLITAIKDNSRLKFVINEENNFVEAFEKRRGSTKLNIEYKDIVIKPQYISIPEE